MPRNSSLNKKLLFYGIKMQKDTTFIVSRKQQYSRKVTWDGIPNNPGVGPIFKMYACYAVLNGTTI